MGKDGAKRNDDSTKKWSNTKHPIQDNEAESPTQESASLATTMKGHSRNGCSGSATKTERCNRRRSDELDGKNLVDPLVRTVQVAHQAPRKEPPPAHCGTNEDGDALITIPLCTPQSDIEALQNATPHPPVTKESLEELELGYIQSNISLRVDLNYDHDLHFTPVSGDKGDQKKKDADWYWLSLEIEFRILFKHNRLDQCANCDERCSSSCDRRVLKKRLPVFKSRLPLLFKKLRELLVILIPERDQYQINENLDIPLLLQEVAHGLLDIVRLAVWLDGLLTSHCAPMRDISAHAMAEKVKQGVERGDTGTLVAGIEMLFQILEAMKLDVANHLIRSFRYPLIEDTVAFQLEFFKSKISQETLAVGEPLVWFSDATDNHKGCSIDCQTLRSQPVAALVHGMVDSCLSPETSLPVTFKYDQKRIREIRVDVQDLIHLSMCIQVYDLLVRELFSQQFKQPQARVVSAKQLNDTRATLQNRIMDITDGNPDDMPQIWKQHAEDIAVEISRAASSLRPGPKCQLPASTVAQTTKSIQRFFAHEQQQHVCAKWLRTRIEQEAHKHIVRFQNMSTLDISHAQKTWQQLRGQRFSWRLLPEVEDIARRLAHIATVHWRVWSNLVYLESPPSQEHDDGVDEVDSISGDDFHKTTMNSMDYVQNRLEHDLHWR